MTIDIAVPGDAKVAMKKKKKIKKISGPEERTKTTVECYDRFCPCGDWCAWNGTRKFLQQPKGEWNHYKDRASHRGQLCLELHDCLEKLWRHIRLQVVARSVDM